MIDSEFIIKYTNALYSTPVEYSPSYDEFRDMFSAGQIKSKEWLIESLSKLPTFYNGKNIAIVGAWYGTLGIALKNRFAGIGVNMVDIDPRCKKFVDNIIYNDPTIQYFTKDMYEYHYKEDFVINTSCEHIPNLREWLNIVPSGKTVILQSNNFVEGAGHINCVTSINEFVEQSGLDKVMYTGELKMPMYTRYMVIGTT